MLEYFFAIITIGCSFGMYFYRFDEIWLAFIITNINAFLQSISIFLSLSKKYPRIIYSCENYEPSSKVLIFRAFIVLLFWGLPLLLLYTSLLFTMNPCSSLLHSILILIDLYVLVSYLKNGFTDYSGHAFSEYLQRNNNREIGFSLLPFSVPEELMEPYLNEYYIKKFEFPE